MLAGIAKYYYSPGMAADVQQLVTSCNMCRRMKYVGLLEPLPVPEQPWKVVSLDFITGLSSTSGGHDAMSTGVGCGPVLAWAEPTLWSGVKGVQPTYTRHRLWGGRPSGQRDLVVDKGGANVDLDRGDSGRRAAEHRVAGRRLGNVDFEQPTGCDRLTGVLVDVELVDQKCRRPGAGRPGERST
ncbi:unnamed protein product, partial [Closterium sp. NIES-53]